MSSMVRASVPTSAAPPVGMEAEKSPCPRRVAAAVSARTGPATSSPRMMPASTASAASSSAVTRSFLTRGRVEVSTALVGSSASMSAMASPLAANTGTTAAYTSCESIRWTAERPSASAAEYRSVKAFTGALV